MRILVVEDDYKIAHALQRGLTRLSYAVDIAADGDSGLSMATSEKYDVLIVDVMLPGSINGIALTKQLRATKNKAPILMLTAKDKVLDRAEGLNAGADDYLVKPFAFIELAARVRALLRRPNNLIETKLTYESLELDSTGMEVKRYGEPISLTALEFALLEFFMRHTGQIVTKEQIMQNVWNYEADILPNTVEVYVGYLRNKIEKPFSDAQPLITTKRGFGYMFGRS